MTNIKTTIGGTMLAVGAGLQVAPVPAKYQWIGPALIAAGGALLGFSAKDYDTHSTADQVARATQAALENKK